MTGWETGAGVKLAQGDQKEGLPRELAWGLPVTPVDPLGAKAGARSSQARLGLGHTSSQAAVQMLSREEFLFQVRWLQETIPTSRPPRDSEQRAFPFLERLLSFQQGCCVNGRMLSLYIGAKAPWEFSWLNPQHQREGRTTGLKSTMCLVRFHARHSAYRTVC